MKSKDVDSTLETINALRFKVLELKRKCRKLIIELDIYTNSVEKREIVKLITEMKIEAIL